MYITNDPPSTRLREPRGARAEDRGLEGQHQLRQLPTRHAVRALGHVLVVGTRWGPGGPDGHRKSHGKNMGKGSLNQEKSMDFMGFLEMIYGNLMIAKLIFT